MKIKINKCPAENFLSLKYLCNVKTNSVGNNTLKIENKTWSNIQQEIFSVSESIDSFGVINSSFPKNV